MKIKNTVLCFITMLTIIIAMNIFLPASVNAAAYDYPIQEIELVTTSGAYLTANGQSDNSLVATQSSYSKTANQRWKLTHVSENCFKIVNTSNGRLLTPSSFNVQNNSQCVSYGDANKQEQIWYITGVDKDSQGNYLNYKITNYKNQNLALTVNSNNTLSLNSYSGADKQKFRLNSSGLEGFAGYGKDINNNTKAGTLGGVLGQTVTADSLSSFQNYAKDNTPRTIVITKNITASGLTKVQIGKNKTIIGAYGTYINNLYFYLTDSNTCGNLIMKNLKISHDAKINANNDIPLYLSAGSNYWIDHCTFTGHDMSKDTSIHSNDVDKLMYVGHKADYVSVSNSRFTDHKYGLILGYPADDDASQSVYTGYPRMTIYDNYFANMTCRAPGLMRYGYFHCYNNYIDNCHLAYTACTNANIYSEKNYFNNVAGIVDDKGNAKFSDYGSYPNVTAPSSPRTYWNPSSHYNYNTMNYTSLNNYCKNYSGAQTSRNTMYYATYSGAGVPSYNYVVTSSASSSSSSGNSNLTSSITSGTTYYIKNAESGLYLDVENGSDANGANVRQWTGIGYNAQKFTAIDVGNGYFKLVAKAGNGQKVLDVSRKSSANGANIELYSDNGGVNQQFLIKNVGNNKFEICTRISNNNSRVEVANSSKTAGANVQQNEANNKACQQWYFEIAR